MDAQDVSGRRLLFDDSRKLEKRRTFSIWQ